MSPVTTETSHIFHRTLRDTWPRVSHGEGVYVYDVDGNRYLDACAGVHVVSIGHGVPEVIAAMREQASKICFAYSRFVSDAQLDLADKIVGITPPGLDRVFFVSGGSEATESAMKMARKYHLARGNASKFKVVSRWQSWHGNTVGALSMSGRSTWREDYAPYLLNFPHINPPYPYRCPYCAERNACSLDCADELERVIKQEGPDSISAFIAEPILGTSAGGVMPPPDYYPRIREICDRYDVLMIVDEVVTGFGRTGLDFGIQHWDVVPDIMATGKGLSSGYSPIAATVARGDIYDAIYDKSDSFVHGHTYGGNALSCATALAVQNYIADNDLVSKCAHMGDRMLEKLKPLEAMPHVGEVRGKGLLLGIEFVADKVTRAPFDPALGLTNRIVGNAFDKGVLVMAGSPGLVEGKSGDHIAISPPFTITESEVDDVVDIVTESIQDVCDQLN